MGHQCNNEIHVIFFFSYSEFRRNMKRLHFLAFPRELNTSKPFFVRVCIRSPASASNSMDFIKKETKLSVHIVRGVCERERIYPIFQLHGIQFSMHSASVFVGCESHRFRRCLFIISQVRVQKIRLFRLSRFRVCTRPNHFGR